MITWKGRGSRLCFEYRIQHSSNEQHWCCREQDVKRVYYMSMEFLMGRSLLNALFNLDVTGQYGEALQEMGYSLESLVEQERDAVCSSLASFCFNPTHSMHANVCVCLCALMCSCCMSLSGQINSLGGCKRQSGIEAACCLGTGERWAGATGSMFHGLDGHPGPACMGLWHSIPIWCATAGVLWCKKPTDRARG